MVEERFVAGGGRVMELVDDDDVELFRVERGGVVGVDRLDRSEDVLPAGGAVAANPQLAERAVSQHVPERRLALLEDLGPMGDEEQPGAIQLGAKVAIVERRHDRLAGTRGGGNQRVC